MVIAVSLRAQENRTYYSSDTLNYQQLLKDYVSMNNQIIQFRKCELQSVGFGLGAGALGVASYFVAKRSTEGAIAFGVAAAGLGVASLVSGISGYTKLKQNQLEITPQGVIVKLPPQKSPRKTKR